MENKDIEKISDEVVEQVTGGDSNGKKRERACPLCGATFRMEYPSDSIPYNDHLKQCLLEKSNK